MPDISVAIRVDRIANLLTVTVADVLLGIVAQVVRDLDFGAEHFAGLVDLLANRESVDTAEFIVVVPRHDRVVAGHQMGVGVLVALTRTGEVRHQSGDFGAAGNLDDHGADISSRVP